MKKTYKLRILHISDIHDRGKLEDEPGRRKLVLGGEWVANIKAFLEDGPIDLVCCTGDVADWGDEDSHGQYTSITPFFTELLALLNLARDKLFIVPGNHDINRGPKATWQEWTARRQALLKSSPTDVGRWMFGLSAKPDCVPDDMQTVLSIRRREAVRWLESNSAVSGYSANGLGFQHTLRLPGLPFDIHMVGLDSAWLSGDDSDVGQLLLTDTQVLRMTTDPRGEPLPGLRIGLVHHPTEWLDERDRIACAPILARNLDLLLRGHLHEPEFLLKQTPDTSLLEIAAGCLYEAKQGNQYPNACHTITTTLDERGTPLFHQMRFRSWAKRGHWFDDGGVYKAAPNGKMTWSVAAAKSSADPPITESWEKLRQIFDIEAASARTAIAGTIVLPRENELTRIEDLLGGGGVFVLTGESGTGKSALARALYERRRDTTHACWIGLSLRQVRTAHATWSSALGLNHPLSLVLADPPARALVVVDGLDRDLSDASCDLLAAFLTEAKIRVGVAGGWTILVTSRSDTWESLRNTLERRVFPAEGLRQVMATPISTDELQNSAAPPVPEALRLAITKLSGIKNLKLIDLICVEALRGGDNLDRGSIPQWWMRYFVEGQGNNKLARRNFVLRLAEKEDVQRLPHVPLEGRGNDELEVVQELIGDGILRSQGSAVWFEHDIFGDWTRQSQISIQPGSLRAELGRFDKGPRWRRSIGGYLADAPELATALLNEFMSRDEALSTSDAWLYDQAARAVAQNASVLSPTWDSLKSLEGEYPRFARLLEPFARAEVSGVESWEAMLTWTEANFEYAFEEMPETLIKSFRAAISLLPQGSSRTLAVSFVLNLSSQCIDGDEYISNSTDLIQALFLALDDDYAEVSRLLLVAVGLEPPRRQTNVVEPDVLPFKGAKAHEHGQRRSAQDGGPQFPTNSDVIREMWHSTQFRLVCTRDPNFARRLLFAAALKPPSTDHEPYRTDFGQDLGFEDYNGFIVDAPYYGPFLTLLLADFSAGADLICGLADRFSTAVDGLHGRKPLSIHFTGRLLTLAGGYEGFAAHRWTHSSHVVCCSLQALEYFILKRGTRERIQLLADRLQSTAVLGVLVAIAKRFPLLLRDVLLPLVAIPEIMLWDAKVRSTLGSLWQIGQYNDRSPTYVEWNSDPTRQLAWLAVLHPQYQVEVVAQELQAMRARFLADTDKGEQIPEDFKAIVDTAFDPRNNRVEYAPDGTGIVQNDALTDLFRRLQSASEEGLAPIAAFNLQARLADAFGSESLAPEVLVNLKSRLSRMVEHATAGRIDAPTLEALRYDTETVQVLFGNDPINESWVASTAATWDSGIGLSLSVRDDGASDVQVPSGPCIAVVLAWCSNVDSRAWRWRVGEVIACGAARTMQSVFRVIAKRVPEAELRLLVQLAVKASFLRLHMILHRGAPRWRLLRRAGTLRTRSWRASIRPAYLTANPPDSRTATTTAASLIGRLRRAIKEFATSKNRSVESAWTHTLSPQELERIRELRWIPATSSPLVDIDLLGPIFTEVARNAIAHPKPEVIGELIEHAVFCAALLKRQGEAKQQDGLYRREEDLMEFAALMCLSCEGAEQSRRIWQPLTDLSVARKRRAAEFVADLFHARATLGAEADSSRHRYREIFEFCLARTEDRTSAWGHDSTQQALVGLHYAYEGTWTAKYASLWNSIQDELFRWAEVALQSPETVRVFARFVSSEAATSFRERATIAIGNAVNANPVMLQRNARWSTPAVALLRLLGDPYSLPTPAKDAYFQILRAAVSCRDTAASELEHELISRDPSAE